MQELTPTRANLIKAKESLEFSRKGYYLLDKKRTVLVKEMMKLTDEAKAIQGKIGEYFKKGYDALQMVNMTIGIENVQEIAMSISVDDEVDILQRSIMGLEVPVTEFKEKEKSPSYSFYRTNPAMDMAVEDFNKIKYLIYELAEVENSVYKIATEIKKTVKRTNALDKIMIPKYEEDVKKIQEVLEEKEREDFFRLKKVKNKF